ncbi:molybdate ABC transporter substrate-binding protein [Arcobacter sp. YIC-80]|uniref:molybdate ABC transporter substrate-binding protein n=1 Tax=Arcobacter sp. YIC-80 TaxID=3376683 RepID=UPI00384E95BB
MKKILTTMALLSCVSYAQTLNIAVAANVSYAINDLKKAFNKKQSDTKINITLGSSGKLTAQIKNKAPYDIFMSANMKYPQNLYENGLTINKPIVYAKGSLALFSKEKQNFEKGLDILKNKNIKIIAIANPKTAPYGEAAFEALNNAKILDNVKNKFVYGESISQTLSYTFTAANIGLIAKSMLYSPKMSNYKQGINYTDIDTKLYTPIKQGVVILKRAKEKNEAKAFYDFLQSKEAKTILEKYGYIVK